MVMTSRVPGDTGWRNAHLAETEAYGQRRGDRLSGLGRDEIDARALWAVATREFRFSPQRRGCDQARQPGEERE